MALFPRRKMAAVVPQTAAALSGAWWQGAANNLAPFVPAFAEDGPVTRNLAMRIPAVANGVQVIAGTLSSLQLAAWRGTEQLADPTLSSFVANPDPTVPVSWHYAQTLTDAVLHGVAYWHVVDRDSDGRARRAVYVPNEDVDISDLDSDGKARIVHDEIDGANLIQFLGPVAGGICFAGSKALRTAYLLEAAAQRYAVMDMPAGVLENTGLVDLDDTEIDDLLTKWAEARQASATAYLNASVKYTVAQFDATQLQLVEARREADSKIAQLLNLPPSYVNAPAAGSSLTYANVTQKRRDLLDISLAPWVACIQDRLSMDDVTPRGQRVAYDLSAFYRSDLSELVTTGVAGVAAGLFSIEEWRAMAALPTPNNAPAPTPPPQDVNPQ